MEWDGASSAHNVFIPSTPQAARRVCLFTYIFLTDQSCGHDRNRVDGLDISALRKGPTIGTTKMRDALITAQAGMICEKFDHPQKLTVGMTQNMVFGDKDNFEKQETGPFYWSETDRVFHKYDIIEGEKSEKMLVAELRDLLRRHNLDFKGRKDDLIKRCESHVPPISTTKQVSNVKMTGWWGKPKGVFQVLLERGYINPNPQMTKEYTLKGPLDDNGNVRADYSLNLVI